MEEPEANRQSPRGDGQQFTLWTLLGLVTIVCVILAMPQGYVLLATLGFWILLGAVILSLLVLFQAPLFFLLSGTKKRKNGK